MVSDRFLEVELLKKEKKHTGFGALLEVEMCKKCMQLRCEAHFQVKMVKTPNARITFGRSRHDHNNYSYKYNYHYKHNCQYPIQLQLKLQRTLKLQLHYVTLHKLHYNYNCNYRNNYTNYSMLQLHTATATTTLHYITLLYATLMTLYTLHYTKLHDATLHYSYATQHYTLYTTLINNYDYTLC